MIPLLRLADTDPIAVATRDIDAGETVVVGGVTIVVAAGVPLGHKVALRAIAAGETVHTHNLRSDYIPTCTLQAGHRFGEGA